MVLTVAKCFTSDDGNTVAYSFADGEVEAKNALHILDQALPFRKGQARETELQRAAHIKARFNVPHVRACAKRMRTLAKQVVTDIQLPAALFLVVPMPLTHLIMFFS